MKFMDVKDLFPAGRGENPAKGKAAPARGKMPGHAAAGLLTGMTLTDTPPFRPGQADSGFTKALH